MPITNTVATTCRRHTSHMDNVTASTASITSTSLLNRLMTRPMGVVSKKARGRRKVVTSMPWWRRLEARRLPHASSSATEKERVPTVQQHSLSSYSTATQSRLSPKSLTCWLQCGKTHLSSSCLLITKSYKNCSNRMCIILRPKASWKGKGERVPQCSDSLRFYRHRLLLQQPALHQHKHQHVSLS